MSIIAGCFYGLAHLLTNFTHSVQEGIDCYSLLQFVNIDVIDGFYFTGCCLHQYIIVITAS